MFTLHLEITTPCGGPTIYGAAREAVRLAQLWSVTVAFKFNDIECRAAPDDDADAVCSRYNRDHEARRLAGK